MRRVALFLGFVGLLGLGACKPTYPNCNEDEHCKEQNEVCVQGQCRECATDAQCKEGFVCQENRCVPRPTEARAGDCASDADCASGKCRNNRCLAEGACATVDDCPGGQDCQAGRCVAAVAQDDCSMEPIRFEFNESALTSDAQRRLEQVAACIKKQNLKLRLEGHADERGTDEYNMQLSNRRAETVRKYLTTLGVQQGALDAIGYGENRPAQSGSSEDAYSANRRVELNRR